MRVWATCCLLFLICLFSDPCGFAGSAKAQANNTAQRPSDLLIFGGYGYTRPDYGTAHNNGVTLGADYDRSFGWRVIPGFELRANLNSGELVGQHTYLFGPRAHITLKQRYHPYGEFLVGLGKITYPGIGTTIHDRGLAYSLGGGVDIDVTRNLMFKADYQYQSWNLGVNASQKPQGGDFTLNPTVFTVGVTWRIPFRKWLDAAHNHN